MSPIEVHAVYSSAKHVPTKVRAFVGYLEAQLKTFPAFDSESRIQPSR